MWIATWSYAQEPMAFFQLSEVTLDDGPFKEALQTDFSYIKQLNPDRLLAPFLRESGLTPKAISYTNWENSGLDGHTLGHYVSALSMYWASTRDQVADSLLNYTLNELKRVQEANGNGYIGGIPRSKALWDEIKSKNVRPTNFGLNDRWVPLYNIHKTFAGLKDAWVHAKKDIAKKMLISLTDWFIETTRPLSDNQVQHMLISEHGGLNEVFADLYDLIDDEKYLKLALRFSQQSTLNALSNNKDILTGMHANTQIPKFVGFNRISQLNGDLKYHKAASHFFDNVTQKRTLSIGGNSVREHFNEVNDFSEVLTSEQGPETCNSYNMLKLSKSLYRDLENEKYIHYYEQTLYNHILSTQNPNGGFVYFTPMRPGHYRVYSQPETSFWCCVGSGLENHTKYNELIYSKKPDQLFVHLFISSKVDWKEKNARIVQETKFPDKPETTLTWQSEKPVQATLNIRYPQWVKENELDVELNGIPVEINSTPGSYLSIKRVWKSEDKILIKTPMHLEWIPIPDNSGYYSLKYGPIILAAPLSSENQKGMFADDSRGGHIAQGDYMNRLEVPMFKSKNILEIIDGIKKVPSEELSFKVTDNIYPKKYRPMTLKPFYKIHEKRYSLYFKLTNDLELKKMMAEEAAKNKQETALQKQTLDYVAPGEQQSESDHGFRGEQTNNGYNQNRHWRDATAWFSYRLNNKNRKGRLLRITYFKGDVGRRFQIFINGKLIATPTFETQIEDDFFEIDYKIPDNISLNHDQIEVLFKATKNSQTAGIYGVRLLMNTP